MPPELPASPNRSTIPRGLSSKQDGSPRSNMFSSLPVLGRPQPDAQDSPVGRTKSQRRRKRDVLLASYAQQSLLGLISAIGKDAQATQKHTRGRTGSRVESSDSDGASTEGEVEKIEPMSSSIHAIHASSKGKQRALEENDEERSDLSNLPSSNILGARKLSAQSGITSDDDVESRHPQSSCSSSDERTEPEEGSSLGHLSPQASTSLHSSASSSSRARSPIISVSTQNLGKYSTSSTKSLSSPRRSKVKLASSQTAAEKRDLLAEKLKEIFNLPEKEEIIAEYSAFLFRSVLLQGYLYLTKGHICFYAYLRAKEGQILRSGGLYKRSDKSPLYGKKWFVLKDAALFWYPSATEPYFPDGDVSLHYVTAIEPSVHHPKRFRVLTATRRLQFQAETVAARDEWVKVLKKAVFQCQNDGDAVKVAIPLEAIVSIDKSSMEFIEALSIRVLDKENGYSAETYPFCYFSDLQAVYEKVSEALNTYRENNSKAGQNREELNISVLDTTSQDRRRSIASGQDLPISGALEASQSMKRDASVEESTQDLDQSQKEPAPGSSSTGSLQDMSHAGSVATLRIPDNETHFSRSGTPRQQPVPISSVSAETKAHTYPPTIDTEHASHLSSAIDRTWSVPGVPDWMKSAPRRIISAAPSFSLSRPFMSRAVTESIGVNATPRQSLEAEAEDPPAMINDVHSFFSLPKEEITVIRQGCYLFRALPIVGKLYVTTQYICFRSTNILMNTRMILPLKDLIDAQKQNSYRLGYSGLVLVIRGHEELFLEFTTIKARDDARSAIMCKVESIRRDAAEGRTPLQSSSMQEANDLEALLSSPIRETSQARFSPERHDDTPPVMFQSTSSSFVTFRPKESLQFTCLAIGSRGDVQPYIALCKGLMAEGHRARIASHPEYRSWVEGHGISFEEVGGDPAELMRICVDNGMFTVGFLKEGLLKFRGWLDDLLKTSWKACQNTDILIESPSTMAGIHIAEALQIPYYRAFTMTWTRTRAYPHAFAVPEVKLGGQYNYLTYTMFDSVFWKAIAGQINRWRRNELGLLSTSLEKMEQQKVPFLYNFSPAVVPKPLDWPEWVHVTGYWFLDDPDNSAMRKWQPPADLLSFMQEARDNARKIVYIGFGSIVVPDPEALTRIVNEAVERSGVYAIVSKGWSARLAAKHDDAEDLAKRELQEAKERQMMSSAIYTVDSIPHDWLFPKIDAACHHGGSGTTGASLRAGIPTIVKPFFGDQFFQAERVDALGVGTALRKLTAETLTRALLKATTDEKQINQARAIGAEIRKEDGVANAIETIFRDYEYAKSLIKTNTRILDAQHELTEKRASDSASPNLDRHSEIDLLSDSSWGEIASDDLMTRSGIGSTDEDFATSLSRSASQRRG